MKEYNNITSIRRLLIVFIVLLALSGITAVPVSLELTFVHTYIPLTGTAKQFLNEVVAAYYHTDNNYPFLIYGYDWLAFAHILLALLFIGPYRNPVQNIWVIEFGLLACLLVIPTAFIAGHFRHIPIWWRLFDCSFGIFGFIPLLICYKKTLLLKNNTNQLLNQIV